MSAFPGQSPGARGHATRQSHGRGHLVQGEQRSAQHRRLLPGNGAHRFAARQLGEGLERRRRRAEALMRLVQCRRQGWMPGLPTAASPRAWARGLGAACNPPKEENLHQPGILGGRSRQVNAPADWSREPDRLALTSPPARGEYPAPACGQPPGSMSIPEAAAT